MYGVIPLKDWQMKKRIKRLRLLERRGSLAVSNRAESGFKSRWHDRHRAPFYRADHAVNVRLDGSEASLPWAAVSQNYVVSAKGRLAGKNAPASRGLLHSAK